MTNETKILVSLSHTYSARTHELAERTGLSLRATRLALRALDDARFVFCHDDWYERERSQGRYASAIWCMNCETAPLSDKQVTKALNKYKATNGHGGQILCQMGLAR